MTPERGRARPERSAKRSLQAAPDSSHQGASHPPHPFTLVFRCLAPPRTTQALQARQQQRAPHRRQQRAPYRRQPIGAFPSEATRSFPPPVEIVDRLRTQP